MKIAYLLGSLNRGGTETLLLDVFRSQSSVPFSFVGIYRKGGVLAQAFQDTHVPLYHVSRKGSFFVGYLLRLRRVLKQEQVNLVHAQQSVDAVYARLACLGTGIRVVETFHGYDYGSSRLTKFLYALSIRLSAKVIFVSEAQKRYYLSAYHLRDSDKYQVVYNGIDFRKLDFSDKPSAKSDAVQNAKKSSPSAITSAVLKFGTVGNFVRVREQNTLCKFLLLLHDSGVPFDFSFVGKRDDAEPWRYDDCVRFCEAHHLLDQVHFLGSRQDVPQLLACWDAFVYSTSHDTFGIAVVEALAAGLPTFVNDTDVMQEITEQGRLATLYHSLDAHDLLQHFLSFVQRRTSVQAEALEHAHQVRQKYSIALHVAHLSSLYASLLSC